MQVCKYVAIVKEVSPWAIYDSLNIHLSIKLSYAMI